ncbi:MAG: class I SAM-dependent methyltransferase [Campylobacterales bacterium]
MIRLLLDQNVAKQQRIYERLLQRHSTGHRALHWSAPQSQQIRFEQFLKAGDLRGARILDLGCGLGDFYGFLKERGIETDYTGYDIVPGFVKAARLRFDFAGFEERNILKRPPAQQFDYVFASGLFAFGSRLFFKEMNRAAYALAAKAWVFNLYRPSGDDSRFLQLSKADALKLCGQLQPSSLSLDEGYLEDDITFYLYK